MAMNPLPPQAYTKETLLAAYAWVQNQNNSIKEMASTPDILVSLYLKATRDGDSALDRPSIKNFKNELKSLAGLMGQLEKDKMNQMSSEEPTQQASFQQAPPSQSPLQNSAPLGSYDFVETKGREPAKDFPQEPVREQAREQATYMNHTSGSYGAGPSPYSAPHYPPPPPPDSTKSYIDQLDPGSLAMIQEIKKGFNLSSETEALRLLIKLGHLKARKILTE